MSLDAPTLNGNRFGGRPSIVNGSPATKLTPATAKCDLARDLTGEASDAARNPQLGQRVKSIADLRRQASLLPGYLIKGIIGAKTFCAMYGPSGCGKTFVGLDLALHVAAGLSWHGKRVRKAPVLYINLEGYDDFVRRLDAARERLGLSDTDLSNFHVVEFAVDFSTGAPGIDSVTAALARIGVTSLGLIVVDTLNRSFGGADENSASPMGGYVANLSRLTATTGAAVLVVHHTGKKAESGLRGSSVLFASCDTVLSVSQESPGVLEILCEKVKGGPSGEVITAGLTVVPLGVDEDGDALSTCVVVPMTADEAKVASAKATKLSGQQASMMDVLGALIAAGTKGMTLTAGMVSVNDWRDACVAAEFFNGSTKPSAIFATQKKRLLDGGKIKITEGFVMPAKTHQITSPLFDQKQHQKH